MSEQVDLTPSPRILAMLGEINLSQWKCLAELIDNSIDAFLHAPDAAPEDGYQVRVYLPRVKDANAQVRVLDNGSGMAPEKLEKAVKAGWSANDPIGNLGLFGMGFNIATARLGAVTSVWTTRREDASWTGLRIDFADLARRQSYHTPLLSRPKDDPTESGTEVVIERLKPEQGEWFSRQANCSNARKDLARVYSSMLRPGGEPIEFSLYVDGISVNGTRHCVWDGDDGQGRVVQLGSETLRAVQTLDYVLPPRPYCVECWQWLGPQDETCPACGQTTNLVSRERRIHGWVGIQRYLSKNNFGIDLIRNGRKIELLNRDLFSWDFEGVPEPEYPTDDLRGRGRIVGEIHMDHCRLPFTKDRFDRSDPVWDEMVLAVRGDGPLQPLKAKELGRGANTSPLYRLYQAFRRSTPHARVAGSWAKLLVVEDNSRAEEMARGFYAGKAEYQSDAKWHALVQEQDADLLIGDKKVEPLGDGDELLPDEGRTQGEDDGTGRETGQPEPEPVVERESIPSLSREYVDRVLGMKWHVDALRAVPGDELLNHGTLPWCLARDAATGQWSFVVNTGSEAFRSYSLTPLDALLAELAHTALAFAPRDTEATFAAVLASLRADYARSARLDPAELTSQASLLLGDMGRRFTGVYEFADNLAYFDDLTLSEREHILSNAAARSPESTSVPPDVAGSGQFLEFAPGKTLVRFFTLHPELFFDGGQWNRAYAALDYGSPGATAEAQDSLVRYYEGLLRDVVWLAERDTADLASAPRARLLRCALALDLLGSEMSPDE